MNSCVDSALIDAPGDLTVIMPVLNGEPHVAEALQSLSMQTEKDFSVIVLDGGSRDSTCALVRSAAAADTRIRLVERPGEGLVSRLNLGIAMAQTTLIARMDADDVALPNRLAIQRAAFDANPGLVLLGSATVVTDARGRAIRIQKYPLGDRALRAALLETCPFSHPATMFKTEAVRRAGGYREIFEGAEDHDMWLRLSAVGRIANLKDPLLRHRRHDSAMSARLPFLQALASAIAVEEHLKFPAGNAKLTSLLHESAIDRHIIDKAIKILTNKNEKNRFFLNYYRSILFGDYAYTNNGNSEITSFIEKWDHSKSSASNNRRFISIALRSIYISIIRRQFVKKHRQIYSLMIKIIKLISKM